MDEKIVLLLEKKQYLEIKNILEDIHPGDISDIIEGLPPHFGGIVYRLLSKDLAVSVFENLSTPAREMLLNSLKSEEVINTLNDMSPDERTRLFEELPAHVAYRYLSLLSETERKIAYKLLGYQEYTAGRIMTTDFVELHEDFTVKDALDSIRVSSPEKEAIYYCYVMGPKRKLNGVISLRTILLNRPEDLIKDLMNSSVIAVKTDTLQEEVASVMAQYDLLAIPVVDLENRLVGIITHDDIIDVITEEDTEDIHLMGGITATDRDLFDLTVWDNIKRRIGWLTVLILFQTFSTAILERYENALSSVVALSFFIPLLLDTGGNAGTQSSTVVIRAIATGELKPKDSHKVLMKEFLAGLILGGIIGFIGAARAFMSYKNPLIGITVGVSLCVVVAVSSVSGAVLPLIANRFNLDPAVMAGPLITTIVDVVGLITYLEIARIIMKI